MHVKSLRWDAMDDCAVRDYSHVRRRLEKADTHKVCEGQQLGHLTKG